MEIKSKQCVKCDQVFNTPGIQCTECRERTMTTFKQRVRMALNIGYEIPAALIFAKGKKG